MSLFPRSTSRYLTLLSSRARPNHFVWPYSSKVPDQSSSPCLRYIKSNCAIIRSVSTHGATTHYDTLQLSTSAGPAEIKKAFYKLSKKYHPDLQGSSASEQIRKTNSERFVALSNAYTILGDPTKKKKYDSEHVAHSAQSGARGSGSDSATYAGSRRASGLSKRRTKFHGPPPSFYRHSGNASFGGTGQDYARGRTDSDSTRTRAGNLHSSSEHNGYATADASWPINADTNDVPHFNRASHYRTTASVEEHLRQGRKKRRKAWEQAAYTAGAYIKPQGRSNDNTFLDFDNTSGQNKMALLISGIIILGISAPLLLFGAVTR